MLNADSLGNGFQHELSSPVAKKPKVEASEDLDLSTNSTCPVSSPSWPMDVKDNNCCRQYIYDQFSIITYGGEEDWMQLECSTGEKCCRKQPKKKEIKSLKEEATIGAELDTRQPVSLDDTDNHSITNPTLQKSLSLQLEGFSGGRNQPTVLKSSLSTGSLIQSNGEVINQAVTPKSVTFNLPPDHVDDRNTLGNGRLKTGVKKHQAADQDEDGNESEDNEEDTTSHSDDESSSCAAGEVAITKHAVTETCTNSDGNVLAPLKTAELQAMPPPSQPIAKYPMNPPPTVPKMQPMRHPGPMMGFPPYPDPMHYPASAGPFAPHLHQHPSSPITATAPHQHMNGGSGYLPPPPPHHQMGPVPNYHHVLPQPPNGYLNHPPQHLPGGLHQNHAPYQLPPTHPNGYRTPPHNVPPRNMSQPQQQVTNNRYLEEQTSRAMYHPKGPEFHQHLHSHLHQHMHYPSPSNSSPNNLNVSAAPVSQANVPLQNAAATKNTLIMAAQPKGKWCGLHGKIAFMIHLKKRDKAVEEHGSRQFPAPTAAESAINSSSSAASIYPFPSLQPSRNSSFSVVPNSSNSFQQPPSMCNVPSNTNRPPPSHMEAPPPNPHMYNHNPHHPYNPAEPPLGVPMGGPLIPPHAHATPPGCHFGTVPVPTQHNPPAHPSHQISSNYIPPPPN